jgi:hypothetical protein
MQNSANFGLSFFGILTIVFVTLKLCHVINWSWLWVLAPIWIPFAVAISVIAAIWVFYIFVFGSKIF